MTLENTTLNNFENENFFRGVSMSEPMEEAAEGLEISFSSETPVKRELKDGTIFYEVLSHNVGDYDFENINSGNAPFLLDHDSTCSEKHIGAVSSAWVDAGQGRALVRFSEDSEKQAIIKDIKALIRPNISVGYQITGAVYVEDAQDGIPVYRCKWRAYEISSVAIPADWQVGVNRSEEITTFNNPITLTEVQEMTEITPVQPEVVRTPAATVAEIKELCTRNALTSDQALELVGKTMLEAREAVVALIEKRQSEAKIQTIPSNLAPAVHVGEKPEFSMNKAFRAALTQDWKDAGFEQEMCQERAHKSDGLLRFDRNVVILDPNAPVKRAAPVTATVATQGGDLVATQYHPEKLIDALWNKTFLNQLGTDSMLGLTSNASFPVISSNATTNWANEQVTNGMTPQGLTTALKSISPKQNVAKFSMTRQSLIQDVPNVQQKILDQLYNAIAQALDLAALSGVTGAGTTPLSTTGLYNQITGGALLVQGANGLAPNLAALRAFRKKAIASKINVDAMKWLLSGSMVETLQTTLKDSANTASGYILSEGQATLTGNPYVWSQNVASGVTKGTSTAGTNGGVSTAILGKWDDFMVAQWGGIAVEFDYVTGADNSLVYIRSFSFWDMIIKRLESFYMSQDLIG